VSDASVSAWGRKLLQYNIHVGVMFEGDYAAQFSIGASGVQQYLRLDTGSSIMALSGSGLSQDISPVTPYQSSQSSSASCGQAQSFCSSTVFLACVSFIFAVLR
jgi:hypothetical protein